MFGAGAEQQPDGSVYSLLGVEQRGVHRVTPGSTPHTRLGKAAILNLSPSQGHTDETSAARGSDQEWLEKKEGQVWGEEASLLSFRYPRSDQGIQGPTL